MSAMTPGAAARAASRRAEALGARLPPLMVQAERVAATVAQGVHGRRRVGLGDSFWQFRPFLAGDPVSRIDWRQTGKSDRAFIRETEWEAAQTVCLWRDGSPSMRWRSRGQGVEKVERAELLLLAIAALLLRGGERVRLIAPADTPFGGGGRAWSGRAGLEALAETVALLPDEDGLPPQAPVPRHARVLLIGDFLSPLPEVQRVLSRLAAVPVGGHLLQVLDPAEAMLPYAGRVRFRGLEREGDHLVPRVEGVRQAYAEVLAAHQAGLAALCAAAGFGFGVHRTDHPPEAALLALYTALAGRGGARG
ncbi:MAG TPA: DUF58 domain-containing protein [Acetobacteraceae bacterium]|nr:DUF58 domain-containing protein [Acetobacteraceae bacterium]